MTTLKIQKVLAHQGLASRRTIEQWLSDGRIALNHKKAKLGDRMHPQDMIHVDGQLITLTPAHTKVPQLLLYHKPVGEICSRRDQDHMLSVFRSLPAPNSGRWVMVGRLDVNTSGLLLFTNSGDLAHQLMHAKFALQREYKVRVLGTLSTDIIKPLTTGVILDDGFAKFDSLRLLPKSKKSANQWCTVQLSEGRNKEVRRMFESQSLQVNRLIRTHFGPYTLPHDLKPGGWQIIKSATEKKVK